MRKIEVGGKLYTIDTSQVTIGDFTKAYEDINSGDDMRKVGALCVIVHKALGKQLFDIPMANYTYVIGEVMLCLVAPMSTEAVDNELRDILEKTESEEDKGL